MKAKMVEAAQGQPYDVLGSRMLVKADAGDTGGALEVVVVQTSRGADVVAHRHPWAETYYMLDGELEVELGARRHRMTSGDFLTIPPKAVHGFRVVSDTAQFLHVSIGSGATDAFRELDQRLPGPAGPDDVPVMLEVGAHHGIELVLPSGV